MSALAHTPGFAHRQTLRTVPQPGRFRRLFDRFLEARQRRADREIAIHLGLTGGHLTDEIERRMNEQLLGGGGFRG